MVVLCLRDIDVASLIEELKKSGLPNLWIPNFDKFIKVDSIPLLGTGKLDFGAVKKIALNEFSRE